jgi:phosphoglycerate dehydrogenase-like enzyme
MKRVLVTPRSLTRDGDPALHLLTLAGYEIVTCTPGKQPDEEALMALLPGCAGYLAGVEPVSARVLENAGALKVISRYGTGIDNIDVEAAERLKIRICRTRGANARGVAELTLGLIFALFRSIPFSDGNLKNGRWERRPGIELENRILGIVGSGEIGKKTALLATGVGMKVIAYDPFPDNTFSLEGFGFGSLDEVYRQADVLSLHCPPLDGGKPLIDENAVSRMKKGVYLVNTARASLVDLDAIWAGLQREKISGVALDVFEKEPPPASMLIRDPRVIATPHIGGYTSESVSKTARQAVQNILDTLNGTQTGGGL